jgi:membrane protein implicated in regulation of membrane protease activity
MSGQRFARTTGSSVFALNTKSVLGPVWIAFIGTAAMLVITIGIWLLVRRHRRRQTQRKDSLRSAAMLSVIARITDEAKAKGEGHEDYREMPKTHYE